MRTVTQTPSRFQDPEFKAKASRLYLERRLYTTSEALEILNRMRSFYLALSESELTEGELELSQHCLAIVKDITRLFEDIETGRAQADIEMAKTIWAQPVMLDGANLVDLEHFLEVVDA